MRTEVCKAIMPKGSQKIVENENHRIIKYPKLNGTHKVHQVQLLAPHGTTQKLDHMPESGVQILLELWPLESCPLPWGTCSMTSSSVEEHFPNLQSDPHHCSMLFPQVLMIYFSL